MRDVNESTVRSIKKQYVRELQYSEDVICTAVRSVTGKTLPPPQLGKYDVEIADYIKKLRNVGSVVNRHILISGAMGIVEYKDRSLQ